ncbi:protein WVD2-like 7 [Actinidia eriantha]|uniref:protein WVD2-like 7 n=1 Tax=Actinidia eriantha TaxID=165200 RepID=UPI00258B348E|nr:protein WVD2-like 7 [Actinidia eriantha]
MGESIVETPNIENKTRGSVVSGVALEVSVSFGRFENDSLSWEKWSSFSPNKYLDEVEKCSTPGSVAQKKAYFEAHYKKIAARKAEQLELEKQMETNSSMKDDQNSQEHVGNASLTETELGIANGLRSVQVEQVTNSLGVSSSSHSDVSIENAAINIECQSSLADGAKEEMDSIQDSLELNKSEEAVLVQEDTHLNGFAGKVDLPSVSVKEAAHLNGSRDKMGMESPINLKKGTGNTMENRKENKKLDASNKSQKMIPSKTERSLEGIKKKPTSPLPKKTPEYSTPKTSKPTSTGNVMSASRSTTKKANVSSLPRSKKFSAGESKKLAPSVHMSLSLGHANSDSPYLTTTRKSLIMEKMGDKDIVKRAFKTFQNNFNQVRASGDEKSSGRKEVPITRPEPKSSTSLTTRKENEGIRKAPEKMDAKRAQLGRSWNTTSTGLLQGVGMDQRSAKPAPSFGLRSGERAEPRKDFSKKSEEKSFAEETEKTCLSSKSKEEKREAAMKKLRQSLNFKATPMPAFYRGHAISKSPLDKDSAKNKHHH